MDASVWNLTRSFGYEIGSNLQHVRGCGYPTQFLSLVANTKDGRHLQLRALNFAFGGSLQYDIMTGDKNSRRETTTCNKAEFDDRYDERVVAQYSIDDGHTWVHLDTFDVAGGVTPKSFSLEVCAWSTQTIFRWYQKPGSWDSHNAEGVDQVSMDNLIGRAQQESTSSAGGSRPWGAGRGGGGTCLTLSQAPVWSGRTSPLAPLCNPSPCTPTSASSRRTGKPAWEPPHP